MVSLKFRIYIIAGIYSIVFIYLYLVKRKEANPIFNFMFDYKDDVLSFNNFVDRIYSIEPEIKDIPDTEALVHILFFC